MECIEARALKSSFLSQMGMNMMMTNNNNNNNSQVLYNDDVWCFNSVCDDFPVEDLLNLDFSEKEFEDFGEYDEEKVSEKGGNSEDNNSSSNFSDEFDTLSAGDLAVPVDELENLEWLSQFVDDSSTGLSLLCPAGSFSVKTGGIPANRVEPVRKPVKRTRAPCFPLPVPVKPRSKRSRSNGSRWSMSLTSADSSSTTSSTSHGSSTLSPFVFMNPVHDAEWFSSVEKPVAKKLKRKTEESGLVTGRRCTHCQVNRTPQWRTGPLGPKTLCNACGVRFKSGRLFPEYRPACSPTFSQDLHSNSHRKVLEMRRKTEDKAETVPV